MSLLDKVVINCASSSVVGAIFTKVDNQLLLKDFSYQAIPFSASDHSPEERAEVLAKAIGKLFEPFKLKGYKSAHFIISGADLLTKSAKIPHVAVEKRKQMIAFEAQGQIPYELNEVVWDSFVAGDDGVETEVIFLAAQKRFVERFSEAVGQQGIIINGITGGPLLDYHALKASQADRSEDDTPMPPTLLVDIGSVSCNFSFIDEDGIGLRNFTYGCNHVSQEIAEATNKSFEEADKLRLGISQGAYLGTEAEQAAYKQASESYSQRIGKEITRSALAYLQKRRRKLERVILDGGGSLVEKLSDYLTEHTKIPTEVLNTSSAWSLDDSVKEGAFLKQNPHLVTEILGWIQASMREEEVINLLPTNVSWQIAFSKRKFCLFASALLMAVAPLPSAFQYYMQNIMAKQQEASLTQRIEQMRKTHLQMAETSKIIGETAEKVRAAREVQQNKANWILLLADLQNLLQGVEDTWLVSLQLDRKVVDRVRSNVGRGQGNGAKARRVLNLSGNLLIRDDKIEEASKRVDRLIKSFERSSFIDAILEQNLDPNDKRILKFKFAVALNPKKPL